MTGYADLNVVADPDVVAGLNVVGLHRTLDQELIAILRRASLECPVCGEFLLHRADGIGCPQCGLELPCGLELAGATEAAGVTDESVV